jgi:peptidoglycan/LPS O-acetylase OafA/YrhL
MSKAKDIPATLSDYMLGIATLIFMLCLLQATAVAPSARWVSLSRLGARFSYTLYVVHFPLLVLLTSFVVGDNRWYPELHHFLVASVLLATAIGYALGVAWLTEFRTDRVRSWVEGRLLPSRQVAPTIVSKVDVS